MSFLKKKSLLACVGIGTLCALAVTALLLAPCAWAIRGELLPESAGWLCAAGSGGLGVLASTAFIVRVRRRQAMATGGAIGGCCLRLFAAPWVGRDMASACGWEPWRPPFWPAAWPARCCPAAEKARNGAVIRQH